MFDTDIANLKLEFCHLWPEVKSVLNIKYSNFRLNQYTKNNT